MRHQAILLATAALLFSTHAQAGDKAAPYFEIYGGYLNTDAPGVLSFGINSVAAVLPANSERFMSIDDGFFAGIALGTPLRSGPFGSMEFYYERTQFNDAADSVTAGVGGNNTVILPNAGGNTETGVLAGLNTAVLERGRNETGLRFGVPHFNNLPFDVAVEPFMGWGNENSASTLSNGQVLSGDLDWGFGGVLLSATHRMPMSDHVAFVTRAAGGVYYYSADGDYQLTGFGADTLAINDNNFGFRGQLELALENQLSSNVTATLFGGLDYWSAQPVTQFPNTIITGSPTTINDPDALELRVGAKLRVSLQ